MSEFGQNRNFQNTPLGDGGGKTLFDKIWEKHVIRQIEGGPSVLYIDKHFIHEVTSPAGIYRIEQTRHQGFSSTSNCCNC